jgi:23S rRNA G2445 N2-methylase RlmL
MKYYSTFPKGFLSLVEEILLKNKEKVQIITKGDEYIYYSTSCDVDEVKKYNIFEQTFYIIKYFSKSFDFKNQINWIKSNPELLSKELSKFGNTKKFRIVGSSSFLKKSLIQKEIDRIDLSGFLDNKSPDYDIRIVEKEKHGFIGIKISSSSESIDKWQKNSLRKEIAYYMLYLSDISKDDVFLDPFCGGGILPLMRKDMGIYRKIICADIDTKYVKDKLKGVLRIKDFVVIESDIDDLEKEMENGFKVNKIVTDPPWGYIQDIEDLEKFYYNILDKFYTLTINQSLVIILTPHFDIIRKYIKENADRYVLLCTVNGQVSGTNSYIIKLRRL